MKDNRGVTLIELVVAIAILSAILLSIYSFYIVGVKGYARETTTAVNQTSIRRASNEIAREIRRAETVEVDPAAINNGSLLKLTYSEGSDVKAVFYKLEDNNLKKLHFTSQPPTADYITIISDRVKTFDIHKDDITNQITIKIVSIENADGDTDELETVITIRQ